MKKKLLFIQGGGGHAVHDEWDNKLVEGLKRKLGPDYTIRYPRMPNEDDPKFGPWKAALRKELGKLDDGDVVVGHSIGATMLIHTLAEEPSTRAPSGIFLISAPFFGEGGWPSDEIEPHPKLGAKLPAHTPVFLYQAGADQTVPAAHVELYKKAIPQAVVRTLQGRDHQLDNDMCEVAADVTAQVA